MINLMLLLTPMYLSLLINVQQGLTGIQQHFIHSKVSDLILCTILILYLYRFILFVLNRSLVTGSLFAPILLMQCLTVY